MLRKTSYVLSFHFVLYLTHTFNIKFLDTVKPVIYNCKVFLLFTHFVPCHCISRRAILRSSNNLHGILLFSEKHGKYACKEYFVYLEVTPSLSVSQAIFVERGLNNLESSLGYLRWGKCKFLQYALMISDTEKTKIFISFLVISPKRSFAVIYFPNSTVRKVHF